MKVLFDMAYIVEPEPAGVKIYGFELVTNMAKYYPDVKLAVIGMAAQEDYIRSSIKGEIVYIPVNDDVRQWAHHAQNHYMGVRKWKEHDARTFEQIAEYDVCVTSFANGPLIDFSQYIRHIGVIHDLQGQAIAWAQKKSWDTVRSIFRSWQKYRRLHAIVAISNATKAQVDRFCFRNSTLIYNSITHMDYMAEKPKDFPADFDDYILDVNSFFRYKNAKTLIQAFCMIKDYYPQLKLYFKGNNNPDYESLLTMVQELGIENRVKFDREFRSSEEMAWLYQNAKLFVSPSLMEGFGYTPLEAILNKVPTIVSDIKTLREVTRGCATLFNPYSAEELASLVKNHLESQFTDEELDKRADYIRQYYSSENQVRKFMDVIEETVNR